jgi:phospholipase/carboxylesterase
MSRRFPKLTTTACRRHAIPAPSRQPSSVAADDWLGGDRLFSPLGYEPGYDYPLLVWLPDSAGRKPFHLGRVMTRVSLRNFVAVEPAVAGDLRDADALERSVWRAIDRVSDRMAIHPDRIFLLGTGAGGSAAFRMACRHPQAFGGVVSIGGLFPLDEGLFARLHEVRRLPMLLCCHGSAAPAATRHTDRTLRLFHAAGATLAMRIYAGHHHLSQSILGDVNRWLMDEICGASVPLRPASTR